MRARRIVDSSRVAERTNRYGRFEKAIQRWEANRLEPSWHYPDPPNQYANNRHILSWWGPEHDALLKGLIDEHAWAWHSNLTADMIASVDPSGYEQWTKTDPLCERYASYNVILNFAVARANAIGLTDALPKPVVRKCAGCGHKFRSNSLPGNISPHGDRKFCAACLYKAFVADGDHLATRDGVSAWIVEMVEALQRIPTQGIITSAAGELPPAEDARTPSIVKLLIHKPAVECVRNYFGTWFQALIATGVIEASGMRMARGTRCLADDGHVCHSIGEKTIDDLLHSAGIEHEREPKYPEGKFRADFKVGETLVEFFGLAGNEEYDAKSEVKRDIAARNAIPLIEVFPRDLANLTRLRKRLEAAGGGTQNARAN
jgi:hypothetical protein